MTQSGPTSWKLFVDGASRNNPGPSGAGIYGMRDNKPLISEGYFLGSKTNNEAEYLALLLGLLLLKDHYKPGDVVRVVSDSQLMVRQLRGEYRVKKPNLKILHGVAASLVNEFDAQLAHVLRSDNETADWLANQGIDQKVAVPAPMAETLQRYGIQVS